MKSLEDWFLRNEALSRENGIVSEYGIVLVPFMHGKSSLREANLFVEVGSVVGEDVRDLTGAIDQLAAWYK